MQPELSRRLTLLLDVVAENAARNSYKLEIGVKSKLGKLSRAKWKWGLIFTLHSSSQTLLRTNNRSPMSKAKIRPRLRFETPPSFCLPRLRFVCYHNVSVFRCRSRPTIFLHPWSSLRSCSILLARIRNPQARCRMFQWAYLE